MKSKKIMVSVSEEEQKSFTIPIKVQHKKVKPKKVIIEVNESTWP